MPNQITDRLWQKLLGDYTEPASPNDPQDNPQRLVDLIDPSRTVVSDDNADGVFVLRGRLLDDRYISLRATRRGINAIKIGPAPNAVDPDLQRKRVAARVGLVQEAKTKAVR